MSTYPVADWPTGKPGNFPVRPLGFVAWRPHEDNRQNTKKSALNIINYEIQTTMFTCCYTTNRKCQTQLMNLCV